MSTQLPFTAYLIIWFGLVLFRGAAGTPIAVGETPALRPTLCELFAHPQKYVGKDLMVSARITQTKDGSDIWDPSCPNAGALLQTNPSTESDPTIVKLYRTLRLHGLSDHPVTATLHGILKEEQYEKVPNKRRLIFIVAAASDISRTKHIERRKFRAPS